ncbi:hypothetical protein MACJ_002774 [Theileria orientalis]|uniref:Uncharacterized protein n=1 Tax=Theileria orientalis TaxID=68886 RepID=A0A976M6Q0_THEOR|nr:hypothetical protein MACJ_002774 [Theileria orientalis]
MVYKSNNRRIERQCVACVYINKIQTSINFYSICIKSTSESEFTESINGKKLKRKKVAMIVTQLSSGSDDSEVCLEGEVIEPENEGAPSTLEKSLEYYLKEVETNEFHKSIMGSADTNTFSRVDSDSDMDFTLGDNEEGGEFSFESLGRRLKTLVDIVTEPIKVECPTSSSGSPEASDDEQTFAIIPSFKRISTGIINETSKFFKTAGSGTITVDSKNNTRDSSDEVKASDESDEELDGGNLLDEVEGPLENTADGIGNNWNVDIISKWF